MISGWKTVTASEFCASVRDGTHDSPKPVEHGEFLITSRHIVGRQLDLENAYRISKADFDAINRRSKVDQWDVLISMIGTVGEPCLVKHVPNFAIKNIGLFKTKGEDEGRWLFYYLQSPDAQDLIRRQSRGSTQQYIPLGALRDFPVSVPSDPREMSAITGVLGVLDDKIEQNRRTARALEELARTIFRAWFVDFEPVKAKAGGATGFPSMLQPVFDALPASFVDAAIGPVPEGWKVKAIGDVVTTKGGGTPSTKKPEHWDGGEHCWATPKDMSRLSHPVLLDTERRITEAGVNVISSGMLPVGTVLMSSRAPVGYLAIAGVSTAINQGFIAMVCDGPLPPTYVLNWAFTSMDAIKAHASGTTFPEISKKNFRPLPVVLPTDDVIGAYHEAVDSLFDLLTSCVRESERLSAVRDYLLPRLLSGVVSVRP